MQESSKGCRARVQWKVTEEYQRKNAIFQPMLLLCGEGWEWKQEVHFGGTMWFR